MRAVRPLAPRLARPAAEELELRPLPRGQIEDRLVDALWGEEPPQSAANSIQVYVSKLRRLLDEGEPSTDGANKPYFQAFVGGRNSSVRKTS